jgi:hypothetical protein
LWIYSSMPAYPASTPLVDTARHLLSWNLLSWNFLRGVATGRYKAIARRLWLRTDTAAGGILVAVREHVRVEEPLYDGTAAP